MSKTVKQEIAEKWNVSSENYDNHYAHGIHSEKENEEWKKLLKSIINKDKCDVLDVGAGTGVLSIILAQLGYNVKGVDLSEGMLSKAKEKAKKLELKNTNFVIGDAENLDEKDNSYDVVINRHLLWTLPHPKQAIEEWIRVLKPGGKLIIIDGDWFYDKPLNKIKVAIGNLMVKIMEPSEGKKGGSSYSKEVTEKLPMMHPENAKKAVEIVKETGISIEVLDAKAVEKAELAAMPLRHRLRNPYKRIVIVGTKK